MGISKKKIQKYIEYAYIKIKLFFTQKVYRKNGVSLKYLYDRAPDSDALVVVFSACVREGLKARYNYVRTLKPLRVNKLFILDDFAADSRGCYYLGEFPEYVIEKSVKEMIRDFCGSTKAKKLFLCGSSKGGWASLNFGLDIDFPSVTVISGAPQYYLGDYIRHFPITFAYLCGKSTCSQEEIVEDLNAHLKNKIVENAAKPAKIYLHYSINEHTYNEHIQYLLNDLLDNGYLIVHDQKEYSDHSEVSLYFTDFLLKSIESELQVRELT